MTKNLLLVFLFLSGCTGLIYEVLWMRLLSLSFGMTVHAVGVVLAAFMAGLAFGAWVFGTFSNRIRHPIAAYGILEVGIGAFALCVPSLIGLLDASYVALAKGSEQHLYTLSLTRFAFASLILAVPAALMGGTLPLLSQFFITRRQETGMIIGRLYGLNTAGAALGPLLAGFALIPTLGMQHTNHLAATINIAIGITCLVWSSFDPEALDGRNMSSHHEGTTVNTSLSPPIAAPESSTTPPVILPVVGLSGFAALGYEVVWTRTIALIVDNTIYAFSLMLSAFLIGLALGSLLYARYIERRRDLFFSFAMLQAGIGLWGLITIPLFQTLAAQFYGYQVGPDPFGGSWGLFVTGQYLLCLAVMLFPTILMGMAFPLACRLIAGHGQSVGLTVGKIYSLNTVGAIFGSLVAAFFLVPLLGMQHTIVAISLLNLGLAMFLVAFNPTARPSRKLACLSGLAVCMIPLGALAVASDLTFQAIPEAEKRQVIYHHEGAGGVVEVVEDTTTGVRSLLSNRLRQEGGTHPRDVYIARQQGYLPLLLHPNPERVLMIGLGTGISHASVRDTRVKEATIVEISPGVIEAAEFFSEYNRSLLTDPKVRVVEQDGRNFLHLTDRQYDLIIQDLFFPYRSGVGNLYTVDHYRQAKRRLKPGGLMSQWISLNQVSPMALGVITATFQSVFPHTSLWMIGGYLAIIGTDEPLYVDVLALKRRAQSRILVQDQQHLGGFRLDDPFEYLTAFLFGETTTAAFVSGSALNTDDNGLIEFQTPKPFDLFYTNELAIKNIARLRETTETIMPYVTNLGTDPRAAREAKQTIRAYAQARQLVLDGMVFRHQGDEDRAFNKYHAAWQLNRNDPYAIDYLRDRFSTSGSQWLDQGRYRKAEEALELALEVDPQMADARYNLGNAYFYQQRYAAAAEQFRLAAALDPSLPGLQYNLGNSLYSIGLFEEASRAFQDAIETRPRFADAYYNLGNAYVQLKQSRDAMDAYQSAIAINPLHKDAQYNLKVVRKVATDGSPQ